MNIGERFTTEEEIRRNFRRVGSLPKAGGPVIFSEGGNSYFDDGESHTMIVGRTGTGKSSCVSKAYVINCLNAGEDVIVFDPKGELFESTVCAAGKHDVHCLDYRTPRKSADCYNPLLAPYQNYKSDDPELNDMAEIQIDSMARNCIYPVIPATDPFWPSASADYFMGLVYALFELGSAEEINMASIFSMMSMSEIAIGGQTLIRRLYESLPDSSPARRCLATYIFAPNETRGSIHSVAANGLAGFCRSKGLSEMLSNDTINVNTVHLGDKPKAIYIIVPDESSSYSVIVATFISQIMQTYIYQAHEYYGGRLPNRLNLIFEEFATIGKCLPDMDNLAVAARSRNIRIMMVLQNGAAQLEELYGKSKTATIMSSIGITFTFSSNSWAALDEVSHFCGDKRMVTNNGFSSEPLISPVKIAAMPIGTALVTVNNRYKYVASLPFYNEIFNVPVCYKKWQRDSDVQREFAVFDMKKYVDEATRRLIASIASDDDFKSLFGSPLNARESLLENIDRRIAELEDMECEEENDNHEYEVVLDFITFSDSRLSEKLAEITGKNAEEFDLHIEVKPYLFKFGTKAEAEEMVIKLMDIGAIARVVEC